MSNPDYYHVLGVSRSATQDELRKAYKKLARELHPDKRPGDKQAATRFAEVTEAWEVLGNPEKKKQYDQFGQTFRGGQSPFGGGNPFQGFGGGGGGQVDLEDLLGGMFGGGFGGGGRRSQQRPRKGSNITTEVTVPFTVAAQGGEYSFSVEQSGTESQITVRIPAGVSSGQTIRLTGQGEPGAGGAPSGDLMVTVRIAPHPWFRREGWNLLVDVPLTPSEAALGARVEVPLLGDDPVMLTIPPGTSGGARLRLRGKGVRNPKSSAPGDQIVVIRITVPKELSDEQRALYEQLQATANESPRTGLWS
ncbi:MAG: DnaJ C-terminal domain-containing protein [Planctomycetaceae bacterium]